MTRKQYVRPNNAQYLDKDEVERIQQTNAANKYALTEKQFMALLKRHKRARAEGDFRTMALIEYRLTDINFHWETQIIRAGHYSDLCAI